MERLTASRTSSMKLRSHLLVLVAATVLPMLLFAVIGSALFVRYQRETFRRGATERTLALITAVDAELRGAVTTLQGLAAIPSLQRHDLAEFHATARRVLESQPDWLTIHLAAPTGEQLVNVLKPYGTPVGMVQERASFDRVVATREPAVSGLVVGELTTVHDFAVRVPVVQDSRVAYVLSGVLSPRVIDRLLAAQRLPPTWVGVVVDGNDRIVSRTVKPGQTVGELASDSLRAALARGPEGWFRGSTIEGSAVYTPFNRSAFSGWTVALGIPASALDATFWQTTLALGGGVFAALAIAWLVAFWLARRLTQPVDALASAARALGHGERVSIPVNTRIAEVGDLGLALQGAAAAVRAREEVQGRLAAIVESSGDAIISYALDGTIQTWNPAASRLFGHAADDIVGRNISQLVPPDLRQELSHVFEAAARGESSRLDTERLRRDGSRVAVSLAMSPIRGAAGAVVGVSAVLRDITEQKRTEDALRAADRAKDEFLAMLGHELRNPLGAIAAARGLLEVVGAADERAGTARAVIGRQVQHLSRLVDDLLDVSRVSSGKIVLRAEPFELSAHATAIMDGWRTAGRFARHAVTMDAAPVWVNADAARMEQVLDNLVGNALKYTPPGGQVAVRVAADETTAVLSVADTGAGMPATLLERVFDPFVQGERAPDRAQGGLGLGLALVKALVSQHGGTVHAASEGPGHGSTFTVHLPRVAPAARPPRAAAPSPAAGARRVLVIEDNDDARDMLSAVLTMAGHEVHAAPNAERGIELAHVVRPDVALVDVGLPGVDGYEVARRLRATEIGKAMRLIAITGYGQPDDRRRTAAAGFDLHLVKPVDPDQLTSIVAGADSVPGAADI